MDNVQNCDSYNNRFLPAEHYNIKEMCIIMNLYI
jgi:hypothetical protein